MTLNQEAQRQIWDLLSHKGLNPHQIAVELKIPYTTVRRYTKRYYALIAEGVEYMKAHPEEADKLEEADERKSEQLKNRKQKEDFEGAAKPIAKGLLQSLAGMMKEYGEGT